MLLFDKIVYGPINSRRLGVSLGVNLSPADGKRCSFDCIYCECGLNADRRTSRPAPSRKEVREALTGKLNEMAKADTYPDVITFSGNGEPTMHPDFGGIIADTLTIRDHIAPTARVAVLSNSTMLHKADVVRALQQADECMMKLDAACDDLLRQIDQPVYRNFSAGEVVEQLCRFDGKLTVQSIFLQGTCNGVAVDNTTDEAVELWIAALCKIRPAMVRIYTVDRETPVRTLQKTPLEKLEQIAGRVREAGFLVAVSG